MDTAASDTKTYTVGIIGTGRPRSAEGWTGFGMAHRHAQGYNASGRCRIVGVCDIVAERAELFNGEHAENQAAVFTDYEKMLGEIKPDIVSVCTWPDLHAPMVIKAAQTGFVKAIHSEKPMAPSWGEAKAMAQAARDNNVQLTFDHQRRFLEAFQTARKLIDEGAIGTVTRFEGACSNMLDWGTHWLNMFSFYNDDVPAKWVMGQTDARSPRFVYGVPHDTQSVCVVGYENNVTGVLFTGETASAIVGDCANRIIGTEGTIEVVHGGGKPDAVRLWTKSGQEGMHEVELVTMPAVTMGDRAIGRGIRDLLDCLDTGAKPLLDVSNALQTTEVIYALYESARRRGRVDLPLTVEDSPLKAMLEQGVFPQGGNGTQTEEDKLRRSQHLAAQAAQAAAAKA